MLKKAHLWYTLLPLFLRARRASFCSTQMHQLSFTLKHLSLACGLVCATSAMASTNVPAPFDYGIVLECESPDASGLAKAHAYLTSKGISPEWLQVSSGPSRLQVGIVPDMALENTVGLSRDKRFGVAADVVDLLDPRRQAKQVPTVSQKEILLALMHPGRLTTYKGADCGVEALKDDVGVRQNIVAWTQNIDFGWPDEVPASWNEQYWIKGTPKAGVDLHEALTDMFVFPDKYAVGCHTAAKMMISGAVLDYYHRVKESPEQAERVKAAMLRDGDPLVATEPGAAWNFEPGFDPAMEKVDGKLLDISRGIGPGSFVPGDWIYMYNTDPITYEKTGYEGSNSIYLGMDRFSDYYNDHEHAFNYKQKINEVYQWRNKVFSRSRDADKIEPLFEDDYRRLSKTPQEGGILMDFRLVPKRF